VQELKKGIDKNRKRRRRSCSMLGWER